MLFKQWTLYFRLSAFCMDNQVKQCEQKHLIFRRPAISDCPNSSAALSILLWHHVLSKLPQSVCPCPLLVTSSFTAFCGIRVVRLVQRNAFLRCCFRADSIVSYSRLFTCEYESNAGTAMFSHLVCCSWSNSARKSVGIKSFVYAYFSATISAAKSGSQISSTPRQSKRVLDTLCSDLRFSWTQVFTGTRYS